MSVSPPTDSPLTLSQIPAPPASRFTYHVGGTSFGLVDGLSLIAMIFTGGSAIGFALQKMNLSAVFMGGASGAVCVNYACYRKYGNLTEALEKLHKTAISLMGALTASNKREEEVSQQLDQTSHDLATSVLESAARQKTINELIEKIDVLTAQLKDFRDDNTVLQSTVGQLRLESNDYEKMNDSLKTQLQELRGENKTFMQQLQKMGALLPQLEAINTSVEHVTLETSANLTTHLNALREETKVTQNWFQQMVLLLEQKEIELKSLQELLQTSEKNLTQARSATTSSEVKVKELSEIYGDFAKELSEIKESVSDALVFFNQHSQLSASISHHQQEERGAITSTAIQVNTLNTKIVDLQKRLSSIRKDEGSSSNV